MKAKRKVINGKLVLEGMRQLKWIGVIGTVLMVLLTVLFSGILYGITGYSDEEGALNFISSVSGGFSNVTANLVWLQVMIYVVLVPVMMVCLFGFVNKRNASDYYDAFPQRRITVYLSYGVSVLLWAVTAAAVSFCMVFLFCLLSTDFGVYSDAANNGMFMPAEANVSVGAYLLQLLGTFGMQFLYTLAGCVLSMGAMAVSMALTGTVFTNIITFLLILLVPRLLFDTVLINYRAMLPMLPFNETWSRITDSSYNIVYGTTLGYFVGAMRNSVMYDPAYLLHYLSSFETGEAAGGAFRMFTVLYSTVLGALYMTAGGVLFGRRKSETAGRPGGGRVFQGFIRTLIALCLTLTATYSLCGLLIHKSGAETSAAGIVIFYLLGTAAYFVYEAIATRKAKCVAKSVLWFPVVIVINAAICLLFTLRTSAVVGVTPNPGQVESISMDTGSDSDYIAYKALPEAEEKFERIRFTSETIKNIVCTELYQEMDAYTRSLTDYMTLLEDRISSYKVTIRYKEDGVSKTAVRQMYFTRQDENDLIGEQVAEMDQMEPVSIELPEYVLNEDTGSQDYFGYYIHCGACAWDFTDSELKELYDCLREEMGERSWPLYTYLGMDYNKDNVFDFLEFTTPASDGRLYSIPISTSTPKTVAKLAKMGNESRTDYDLGKFAETLQNLGSEKYARLAGIVYLKDGEDGLKSNEFIWNDYGSSTNESPEDVLAASRLLESHQETAPTMDENLMMLVYYTDDMMVSTGRWYNLTNEEVKELFRYIRFGVSFHRNGYNY